MITKLCGDSARIMAGMPIESVDLIVTSPPYDNLRTYETCEWDFESTAREMFRVLKLGGVACWVVKNETIDGSESLTAEKQKIFFVEQCGFKVRTLIYQKRNFSHPQRAFYHSVFEYVFVLSVGKPKTFNPIMDRRNLTAGCIGNLGVNTFTERDGSKSVRARKITKEFGMRHDVWLGNTRGQEEMCKKLNHPAMMPKWLARDLILSWSNPGDVVLDPFSGSGTVGQEAEKVGREAILIDVNEKYLAQC